MADQIVQKVIEEVLRQQGINNKQENSNNKENLSYTGQLSPSARPLDSDRNQLTNQLISNIIGTGGQTNQHAAVGTKTEPAKPQLIHQPIKSTKTREELVGFAAGGTVGFVIPNIDPEIRKMMQLPWEDRSIGIISSRVGSAPQVMAVDDAVKKTNSKVVTIQFARDSQGGPGHGVYILLASNDVADVIRAVEISLQRVDDYFADIYSFPVGEVQVHYTARAAEALAKAFGAQLNRAFGILVGAPAGIGLIMSDVAVKTAAVEVTYYSGPSVESAFTNEVWLAFTGDSAAVKNALEAAKEVGIKLLADYSGQLRR
ncbi:MAG: propanediol utilization microcompartment protein PduB [Bacillota bacterium]|nr:propanediol utilization microcompartment protein PduB [Bacillota bacterium]